LEARLFDGEDRLRPGLSEQVAHALLSELNELRRELGWLELDLRHHHIWPTDIAS
jgi:hypothetical protein